MNKLKRGDLIKAAADHVGLAAHDLHAAPAATTDVASVEDGRVAATIAASDQYWFAYHDKSIGLVTKADADHVWVRWCGSRSSNANHVYFNDVKYFELASRIDHE